MSLDPIAPETLRARYAAFLAPGRVLLTGHSHQAWPDVAREGLLRSYEDAAAHVDDKWARAFEVAERVRAAVAARLGAEPREIALGSSTHELVARFLSALDLGRRPHLVTTGGEFHSLDRQLRRLREAGVAVTFVDPAPLETLGGRLAAAVTERTAALLASTVLFESASIVPGLREPVEAAQRVGAEVLLDAYHAFNVVPTHLRELGSEPLFVTAGGYKYAQWGEGCCFLRVPPGCALRPVYTGWFGDFAHLEQARGPGEVAYGSRGADRFAGSTYDPASHYRAASVIDFFADQGLSVERLRALSLRQTQRLLDGLAGHEVITPRAPERRGGFVALRVRGAADLVTRLRAQGVFADSRGDVLRLGPAPYVTDAELDRALAALRRLTGSAVAGA